MNPFNFLFVGASKDPAKRSHTTSKSHYQYADPVSSGYYGPGGDPSGSGEGQAQQSSAARAESPNQTRSTSTGSSGSTASSNTRPAATQVAALNPTIDKADPGKKYLQELGKQSGGILKYPSDLFDKGDDYLKIDICEYEPTLAETQGGGSPLTTFMTYMPRNISTSYNQEWGQVTLSPNGRVIINAVQQGLSGSGRSTVGNYLQGALKGTETTFAAGMIAKGIQQMAPGTSGLDANSILGITQGIGINSTVEMFWQGHGQNRSFSFRIEMSPRNESETTLIRDIIKAFKVSMHPGSSGASAGSSVQSRFVTYPYMMKIKYMNGPKEHEFLHKFKPCVLESMNIEYTPNGQYSTLTNTSPTATVMTLTFKEIRMIYREDIIDGSGAGF